ncbi:MAG: hypothetical protein AB8B69_00340 [Chitinophagales bacterium]
MGFGFNLFFVFILLPLTGVFLIVWAISKKNFFGDALKVIWGGIFGLIILASILQYFTTKMEVRKKDIYGEYIIDRSKFAGHQADWQYENFRFEITDEDEFIFYQINEEKIVKVDTFKAEFIERNVSDRIRVKQRSGMHHIIEEEPTLYRNIWSFYYVFESPKFGNVFFTKGKWKPLRK